MSIRTRQIKISDFVAEELALHGCDLVFGVSGGASLHLLQSIVDHPKLRLINVHHEQTVAMAAEAYSRITGKIGVGVVTSGPGSTNLATGIAGAYFDSVPCLFLTGQVSTFRKSKGLGVRQYGFQETPTAQIFDSITKKVSEIEDRNEVLQAIREAFSTAINGRPGPVVIDIPDNIQREFVTFDLENFGTKQDSEGNFPSSSQSDLSHLRAIQNLIEASKRPVIVCGWGIVLSKREIELLELLDAWQVPVALTWGAKHLVPENRRYLLGTFGTHGNRTANRAIQNADLIISVGSRLDTKATGTPPESFAPHAKKVIFDIDLNEVRKFHEKRLSIDRHFICDFRSSSFLKVIEQLKSTKWNLSEIQNWQIHIEENFVRQEIYPSNANYINPYVFFAELSKLSPSQCRVIVDTGCSIAWTMQCWKVKQGQYIFHDFNNTAMGWSVPASLASLSANDSVMTICIIGDGSLMMTTGELATLQAQEGPLVIFIINNSGYSMIKQTQEQWFNSRYFASDATTGMAFPNFNLLSQAFGFEYLLLNQESRIHELEAVLVRRNVKIIVEVCVDPLARVIPQNRFGNPIDIMEPS